MFRVLVVDDDENVNMFISRLLTKKFKCEVTWAKNGLEALSLVKGVKPEVIFLDITMPVMNGIETLGALRADSDTKDLPVIMLTAVSEKNVVAEIMKLGVFDYMLKPLIYDTTFIRIKEIFERIKKAEEEKFRTMRSNPEEIRTNVAQRFLLAGGDAELKKILRLKLEKYFTIIETENGVDALKLFLSERPSFVCVGENLPLLNETLFVQKIRANSSRNEIKIIYIKRNPTISDDERVLFDNIIIRALNNEVNARNIIEVVEKAKNYKF
ncbi:MAG: response regulator [bacterium]